MNAIENEIASFWKDTLHADENLKESDNFFHLGGHSLHTMHLKHFVSQKFNVDISIKSIFENQTVETLSKLIASKMTPAENGKEENVLVVAEQNGSNGNRDTSSVVKSNLVDTERGYERLAADASAQKNLLPLSFGEESLWFVYQFQEDKTVYTEAKAYRLVGNLNVSALESSLQALVMRHDNLRKKFIEVNGMVKAAVDQNPNFYLKRIHHTDQPLLTFNELADQILQAESRTPFDLAKDLPFRATLVESDDQFLLVLTAHHIVSDAWSFNVIKQDLETFYQAFNSGEKVDLPSLSNQYQSYAQNERQYLGTKKMDELLHFWRSSLKGKIEKLKLPYKRGAGITASYAGDLEEIIMTASLMDSLRSLSREQGATLFMTLLAAFHTLLFRYTKNENVLTGVPFAGREDEDKRDLVGFFVNTLLLSTDFSGDPDFVEILNRVRGNVLDAHEHQNMPFEILATSLRKETGIDANEIIQVMFAFQSVPESKLNLNGLPCITIDLPTTTAKFDIMVYVYDLEEAGCKITMEYRKNLFDQSVIQRMLNHFIILIESIVKNPKQKISKLNFISEEEKDLIIKNWNNTIREIPGKSIHEFFELQVAKTPDREALSFGNTILTYDELNRRANQLAHHLIQSGLSDEEVVGILMNETHEAIISILAILKAGGAYLPLDTSYPQDRLLYMLQNAKTKIVITNEKFRGQLSGHSFQQILIDKHATDIFQGKDANLNKEISLDHLAYVIYTSGSTGKPKGVAIEHRGVVRLLINTNWVMFNSDTRLLKTAAFSFDVSVKEIWGTLFHGGRLFLYSREDLIDHQFLKQRIIEDRINTMYFTSPWLSQLAEIDPTIFSPLKILMGGGDKISAKHINKVMQTNPHLEIINVYGPTENSVWSTSYRIDEPQIEPVLIGKSIPNSTAYIVDDNMQLLPVGIEGEICLGGPGVARCYINNEEKTKEKFVDDPFSPGGRLYKTGDLGRWTEDGNIEFFGRGDHQIKLRGFRVELGEIEHAIANHSLIDETVVIVHGNNEGDKQLICFYTGAEVPLTELKSFLRKSLPEYMIPSRFIRLESFPLTHNGKLNRAELQTIIGNESNGAAKVIEPVLTPTETKLLKIWEDVLDQKGININDNFFQLGGHSLLATKLMARVKIVFNQNFPVSLFYSAPTVKEFAAIISKDVNLRKSNLVPIQPKGNQTPFFVIPGYLFYYHLARYLGEDQPLYGFEPIPDKSVEEISAIYIQQMQLVQPEGPYFIGGYCAGGIVAYEMARQLVEAGHSIGLLALFEVYTPEGVVSKTSLKYIREKIGHLTNKMRIATNGERAQILFKEVKKLFRSRAQLPEEKYVIKPYRGHIYLFKAIDGMVGASDNPYMGWNEYCDPANLEIIEVPGNHDTMFKEPNVSTVAARLDECIFKRKIFMVES